MLGAIIGDVVGSRFEWNNCKSKEFQLFTEDCRPTDDSIMTIAVAEAILNCNGDASKLGDETVKSMQKFGRKYPYAGYGGNFSRWIMSQNPKPYNSFGNGSAMRVSPCGYAANQLEDVVDLAKKTAEVTHNHPEGIKGATVTAAAIFLARTKNSKEDIKSYASKFYNLDFTLDEIRESYTFDVSCQGSVPQAIVAFLESESFEDAIRGAISIGGDSDTIAAITGSIAEAYYGIPEALVEKVKSYLNSELISVINRFQKSQNMI